MKLKDHHILIVEDEIFVAMELEDVVRAAGGNVVGPAMTAPEAFALIENRAVTAAILDVRLGVYNTSGIARRLEAAKIPFIFYTGNAADMISSSDWPSAPVVQKPASARDLLAALTSAINTLQFNANGI